ncbi:MAG: sodium:solute symporter [Planctomycetaceae bacterium]|nr:sodium:solute symporter [Planctomycetaceae bacterium]
MAFSLLDLIIVIVYMVATAALGFWIGRRQKDTTDYFLGGRQVPWFAVTLSIVATETSVLTFISVPAVSYQGNLTFIQLIFGYVVGRLLVALVMIPAYYKGSIETAYHFLGRRFGQKMRSAAGLTFMITRVLADGVRLFATAIPLAVIVKGSGFFEGLSESQFYVLSIIAISLITVLYTTFGGIKSVIWVDMIQWTIYITGALLAALIIIHRLPNGLESLVEPVVNAGKTRWFEPGTGLSLAEFLRQPYTFFTALVGGAVFTLASHGTDQLIVQRVLTCGSLRSSQKALAFSGIVVLFQFILFLGLGLLLFTFYGGQTPQQLGLARADGIFPKFIVEVIPTGISGLVVAALFAAAISTLAGSLSSLSSSAVLDIYVPLFGKDKSPSQLLRISRIVTLCWSLLLMGTATLFISLKGTVIETALSIASYTYGGLLGVFLLGLFYKRACQRDALIAFFTALVSMLFLIHFVKLAWPLYTVTGSLTAVIAGIVSSRIFPSGKREPITLQ